MRLQKLFMARSEKLQWKLSNKETSSGGCLAGHTPFCNKKKGSGNSITETSRTGLHWFDSCFAPPNFLSSISTHVTKYRTVIGPTLW